MSETRCVNDTDGDGDCAACARNSQAPCRVPAQRCCECGEAPDYKLYENYKGQLFCRPCADGNGKTAKTLTFEEVQDVLQKVYDEPYRDSAGNPPDVHLYDAAAAEARAEAKHRLYADQIRAYMDMNRWDPDHTHMPPQAYARGPRSYVQLDGKPYNTHNTRHFMNRYGRFEVGAAPELVVGIWKTTVERMMDWSIREREAVRTMRIIADEGWT